MIAQDSSKPAAMAIPKEGYFEPQDGRYGQIYPRTPANYGFTIIAKIKPGREAAIREYGTKIEKTIAGLPEALAVLKVHYPALGALRYRVGHLLHVSGNF
jgi:hypothetical protein